MDNVIRRGEMWYISQPSSNPSGIALGRPGVVLTNAVGCDVAPEISVVYVTTNISRSGNAENVLLTSPNRQSMAKCNAIPAVPRNWFQYKMCTLTDQEMAEIERAINYAFAMSKRVKNDEQQKILELQEQLDFQKALYKEALSMLAKRQLEADLAAMKPEAPVVEAEEPAPEPDPEPRNLINLNRCSISELLSLNLPTDKADRIFKAQPFTSEMDFKGRSGLTNMQWALVKPRVYFGAIEEEEPPEEPISLEKPEPKKKPKKAKETTAGTQTRKTMVNINTCTWFDLKKKFGFGQDTAKAIIAARKKLGRFTCMEEIACVRRMGKDNIAKVEGRIVFDDADLA